MGKLYQNLHILDKCNLGIYLRASVFLSFLCLVLCSCSLVRGSLGSEQLLPKETVYLHKVKFEGENLSMLAAWYLESESEWPLIAAYNGSQAEKGVHIGQTVFIPEKQTKNARPLQEQFARRFLQKIKNKPTPLSAPAGDLLPAQDESEKENQELVDEFMKKALDENT